MRWLEGYFGVYFPQSNTKITLEWAHQQFIMTVHTLFYFLHDMSTYMMIKKDDFRAPTWSVYILVRASQLIVQCWWWRQNCRAHTWKVISNSSDIDFIHGDIDGWLSGNHIHFRLRCCPCPIPWGLQQCYGMLVTYIIIIREEFQGGRNQPIFKHIEAETKWLPFRRWHICVIRPQL